ncbi:MULTISPECIES: vgr related protein [unclassified Sphingomonas]|uniref:vgr related protein n=1 Tax=unclassified Sphingomonas TaxID=196159 RepID=UPI001F5A44E0|nr:MULTISPECIES: vgr related protein [unclassified Sphingomonas]
MPAARPLTLGEIALARSIFGDAIDYAAVRIVLGKWAFFQPRNTVMAPRGAIHFHPKGTAYCDDFSVAPLSAQGLFIHEMVHVWQHQSGVFLPLRRHPFSRYDYAIRPGVALTGYGIEQQAEIVRHAFVLRGGGHVIGAPERNVYEAILPFGPRRPAAA